MDLIQIKGEHVWVGLDFGKLSEDDARSFLSHENAGAVCIFAGTTRRMTGEEETQRLEYDCYPEMALAEMERIASAALEKWSLHRIVVHHRTGVVPIAEASVLTGASASHRDDAFAACRFLIDTLKDRVPIWKKEIYADGRSEWVGTGVGENLSTRQEGQEGHIEN